MFCKSQSLLIDPQWSINDIVGSTAHTNLLFSSCPQRSFVYCCNPPKIQHPNLWYLWRLLFYQEGKFMNTRVVTAVLVLHLTSCPSLSYPFWACWVTMCRNSSSRCRVSLLQGGSRYTSSCVTKCWSSGSSTIKNEIQGQSSNMA